MYSYYACLICNTSAFQILRQLEIGDVIQIKMCFVLKYGMYFSLYDFISTSDVKCYEAPGTARNETYRTVT
jgi:hypothetical protein